ncbi:hypothetical protein [Rhizobium sp. CG5]|uniref:ribonuclease toxin HepT-like protein n=1 Tax=Rhizobium sp. CG5 TaxID=2726076 RepID=UPI0020337B4F|nr:hypothetical protein [Rhizobium sp. CG5]
MQAIFIDLANELQELADEVEMLRLSAAEHEATKSTLTPQMAWLHIAGLASGIEKVYTGCERIMATIAVQLDKSPISRDQGWHATLLRRMHNAFPGVREALLADDTYDALNDLRAFRHRERNSYGLALDSEIVGQRASEAITAFQLFRRDFANLSRTVVGDTYPSSTHTP